MYFIAINNNKSNLWVIDTLWKIRILTETWHCSAFIFCSGGSEIDIQ